MPQETHVFHDESEQMRTRPNMSEHGRPWRWALHQTPRATSRQRASSDEFACVRLPSKTKRNWAGGTAGHTKHSSFAANPNTSEDVRRRPLTPRVILQDGNSRGRQREMSLVGCPREYFAGGLGGGLDGTPSEKKQQHKQVSKGRVAYGIICCPSVCPHMSRQISQQVLEPL